MSGARIADKLARRGNFDVNDPPPPTPGLVPVPSPRLNSSFVETDCEPKLARTVANARQENGDDEIQLTGSYCSLGCGGCRAGLVERIGVHGPGLPRQYFLLRAGAAGSRRHCCGL